MVAACDAAPHSHALPELACRLVLIVKHHVALRFPCMENLLARPYSPQGIAYLERIVAIKEEDCEKGWTIARTREASVMLPTVPSSPQL
jgi:hypothetical protein